MKEKSIRDTNLWKGIYPYASWFNDKGEEINQEAKQALYEFYENLLEYEPSKKYEIKRQLHLGYLIHLIEMKKAFKEEKYQRVCNELIDLLHYQSVLQRRIYYNLLNILEIELNIREKSNDF